MPYQGWSDELSVAISACDFSEPDSYSIVRHAAVNYSLRHVS